MLCIRTTLRIDLTSSRQQVSVILGADHKNIRVHVCTSPLPSATRHRYLCLCPTTDTYTQTIMCIFHRGAAIDPSDKPIHLCTADTNSKVDYYCNQPRIGHLRRAGKRLLLQLRNASHKCRYIVTSPRSSSTNCTCACMHLACTARRSRLSSASWGNMGKLVRPSTTKKFCSGMGG